MEEQDAQTIWSSLESSGVAVAMREWTWLYPIVEIAHIIGFVVLVGAVFLFDLRLLGVSRGLPVTHLGRHLLRWSCVSLIVVVPTGFLMFMTNATKMAGNPVFRIKLILIVLALQLAVKFNESDFERYQQFEGEQPDVLERINSNPKKLEG
jgi:hypothetical protein